MTDAAALDPNCLFFAAGEASGDHYAAAIYRMLHERRPELRALGLGGAESRAAGIETCVDLKTVSVMGLVEVLAHYGRLRRAMNALIDALDTHRPALVIAIDFQEFNQRLARAARARGIPVLFFVAPQVWAWRPKRARRFGEVADHLAVLFDFEVPLFARYGLPTTHVGHPLRDLIEPELQRPEDPQSRTVPRNQARQALGLDTTGTLIGLLPGSRRSEIGRLLPLMLATADRLLDRHPDWRFALPRAASLDVDWFAAQIEHAHPSERLRRALSLIDGNARRVMTASDTLCIASGTATLEAALIGTPMVITYRTNPLTYFIARHLVHIERVGLPNIMLGRNAVPELIQGAATADHLSDAVTQITMDSSTRVAQIEDLKTVRQHLGDPGALRKLADLAETLLAGANRGDQRPAEPVRR
ncbi:lipid-A-disaccharide synthase [Halothiobacillus diazotrophicus]|uniref:Lipid-A-disaccharide synthase n=1 Tax=Halothiobacillus diazotrophicus TaxID=1860122 RepID=A0A191ZE11_9GAMM|nr:lipid-A-disaccharide synthase [Halothiobacillus diazotrophicus]ANJ66105.1 lipid-A-disaccharide synthase [Halothiobacillus diazotrophicus]